jgi:polyisoprenyl-phosphate glycosyltransferase
MFLSIVIPAYNEANNISKVIAELELNIAGNKEITNYEVIVVDDHSTDNTLDVIKSIHKSNIHAIRLSRRSGSHTAIRAGLSNSKGDIVLCISADGQDDSNVLSQMIQKIKDGKHIIWGVRISRDESFLNRQLTGLFYKLLNLFVANENHIDLAHADFYLLDRKVVDSLNSCKERNTSLFGLIAWIGFKQDEVKYTRRERISGKSNWNFSSKMRLALNWIFAFSGLPLKLISYLGILFSSFGFVYALIIIILSLNGYTTPGWSETVILILIIGGIQMLMIGLIGEYLLRTLDESRKRPLFFIEDKSDNLK